MFEIECPICKHKLIVGHNGKLYNDNTIQREVDNHIRNHNLGEVMEFIELSFADQLNVIEEKLSVGGIDKK